MKLFLVATTSGLLNCPDTAANEDSLLLFRMVSCMQRENERERNDQRASKLILELVLHFHARAIISCCCFESIGDHFGREIKVEHILLLSYYLYSAIEFLTKERFFCTGSNFS